MKLRDFIILSLLVTTWLGICNTMTVQSINELQALLNVYKEELIETETAKLQQKNKQTLPVIKSEDSQICGRKIREIYQKCKNETSEKAVDCDKRYSENYPVCFFGNSIIPGKSSGGKSCSKTCLRYMNNCLTQSNKLEIYLCMGGRDTCMRQCGASQKQGSVVEDRRREVEKTPTLSKRVSCKLECNNNYKTCKTWGDIGKVCDAAHMVCNNNCQKTFQ
uniref:Uncharacterized protein n=1 Tax=Clytia hemisphaerica TaxID=252671 RepID=A0A7M5X6X0_9CNID